MSLCLIVLTTAGAMARPAPELLVEAPPSLEAVADEVRARIDVLGRGGGYILGPSHAIQAGTPPENIVALFDTAGAYPMSAGGA